VAQQQYGGGPFGICDWADVVTVHLVAGASVVTSLKETAAQKGQERGALLIAQMSTADAASKQEGAHRSINEFSYLVEQLIN
jgi:uridine monophosphate synthetase